MPEAQAGAVAPEANEVPPVEAESTTAPEATAAPESEQTPEQTPEERKFSQKELDEILQKRLAKESRRAERLAEARIRAEYAEKRLEQLQPQPQPSQGEPQIGQFQDYESYTKALAQYEAKKLFESYRQETAQQQQQRIQAEQAQAVTKKLSEGFKKYSDFQEVALAEDLPITQAMAAAIAESDVGPDVLYRLGSDYDEAVRISRLSPAAQVREIVKLEAKLTAPPKPTQTPPPIVPNSAKAPSTKSTDDMTDEEWMKWRDSELRKKHGR